MLTDKTRGKTGLRNYLKRNLLILVVSVVSLISFANLSASYAASPAGANGFSISPVLSEITVNKGQSVTVPITLQNPTGVSTTAKPVVNDFVASSDETGSPRLLLKNTSLPDNNFIPLVQPIPSKVIGPNGTATINVTIAVPDNASSGGYYGAVRFIPTATNGSGNVGLTASVGTLFLVTVPGNLIQKLNLVQLSAAVGGQTGSFFTSGNISVVTRLDNVGNIHVVPTGTVSIKNMSGKVIIIQQLNKAGGNILPDSIRKFTNNMPSYKWFGRYTISLAVGYGAGDSNLITSQSTFWYFPVWAILLAIILVVLIVALIYWIVHSIRVRRFGKRL